MSDESVLGGLEQAAGAGWDAVENAGSAALDAATGVGGIFAEGGVGIAAGAAYAVGEYDTASSLDATRNSMIDDVDRYFGDASREAGQAETDIFGN